MVRIITTLSSGTELVRTMTEVVGGGGEGGLGRGRMGGVREVEGRGAERAAGRGVPAAAATFCAEPTLSSTAHGR